MTVVSGALGGNSYTVYFKKKMEVDMDPQRRVVHLGIN
jgi:hypothetical protein